jgi:hypothetical protein
LRAGDAAPIPGFVVTESREGHCEIQRTLPGGAVVRFSGSSESKAFDKASLWLVEQAKRLDGGVTVAA